MSKTRGITAKVARRHEQEHADMVRRLLALHAQCTPSDLAQGLAWYERARAAAEGMSTGNLPRAAAVIAHLSPRQSWAQNLASASRMLTAADAGDARCPAVHTRVQHEKAWAVATGRAAPTANHGPKTLAFYRNILGNTDAVCVDTWALRAATGDSTKGKGLAPGKYRRVAAAYTSAAQALGMAPRDLQAAVWVHVRGAAD